MAQIKDAIALSFDKGGYTLKEIIGANRNISKKMDELEDRIYKETGLYVRDGYILMNPVSEEELVEGYALIIPDTIKTVTRYDSYVLDTDGTIIATGKKRPFEKLIVSEEDCVVIEKYRYILTEYFRLYRLINKRNVYPIIGTDLKLYVDGKNSVLYKESLKQKDVSVDELNPYNTDFYIQMYNGESIKIDYCGPVFAFDCEEIYNMDINEVLDGIRIDAELEPLIKENIIPISVFKTKNLECLPGLRKGYSFKVTDYTPNKEKVDKVLTYILLSITNKKAE